MPRDRCAKRQVCQDTRHDRPGAQARETGQDSRQGHRLLHSLTLQTTRTRTRTLSLSRALSLSLSFTHTHTHTNTHTHTHSLSLSRTHTQDSRRLTLMHTYECTRGIDTRSARLGKKKLTDSDILQHNFILQHYFICPNTQTGVKGFIEYTSSH